MLEPIAIVGSSCRFPGGASSPSKLWKLLKTPRDVLSTIPKDRLGLKAFYHEDGEHHGSTNVVDKAYLLEEDPRLFDAPFFNINPMEADAMDPQQRLLLESVYECFEAAGYPLGRMQGSATSVYVGCMTNDYHDIQGRDLELINRYHGTGSTRSILSNRISYYFDLRGPSVTIDTACSSSLAALHFAVQSLRGGESTSAIVGGVNLIFDSVAYISESKLHMLSPTSRSSMWDASADGYARGEGVSAVMIKTLSQALADGDHIECIIRETGMNQDGRTTGLTMPSGEAQAALIRQTYARAGLDLRVKADRPQYFEAHGTGTLAGDPQEARGIYDAFFGPSASGYEEFQADTNDEILFCGSIKTVIGHLEGCAGLAGLLKASLAIQHGRIPPNLLFKDLNPDIAPYQHHLQVPTEALAWPGGTGPRRVSVNSFGFGGTNVHVIVEQYIPSLPIASTDGQISASEEVFTGPLLLSACTGTSLSASVERLADMLEDESSDVLLQDLAFFTQTRRTLFQQRISFPGGSRSGWIKALREATSSATPSSIGVRAPGLKWRNPGILGIFTGQGAQWATMGRGLLNSSHTFRESLQASEDALSSLPDAPAWSLTEELLREPSESRLNEAALSQPLCTAIQIALVDLLAAAGISFRGVVGHSSGEIAATYAAGLLSAKDAIRVAFYRGLHAHLAQGSNGQSGAMLAVGLGIDDAQVFCERFGGRLSVAASNSSTSTTLSGDKDAVIAAKELLDEGKTFARMLKVDTAYHSSHMTPCAQPYLDSLKACRVQVQPQNEDCIWISSVHGHAEMLDDSKELDALADEYWVANMCQPVLFSEALECSLWRAGPFDVAVEVGPHPALKGPANQTINTALGPNAPPFTATLQRNRNDVEALSATLGSLWTILGSWVDFDGWRRAFLGPECSNTVTVPKNLPTYSWSHEQAYWKESRLSSRYRLAERPPHEILGRRAPDDSDDEMRWRNIMKVNELPWTRGHVFQKAILFPTVGYVAQAIEAAAEMVGAHRIKMVEIRDLVIPRALVLEDSHNGVETVFSVRRQRIQSGDTIEADFACHSSVNGGSLEKNCSGHLIIELFPDDYDGGDHDVPLLPARCPPRSGTTSIDGEAYYQAILKTTGLDYQGLFRGMKRVHRAMGFSTAEASWPVEDVGDRYLLHPGPLDVALQAILAAFVNPTRIPIRGSFLPSALSRLVFDPHARTVTDDGETVVFQSDCFLTKNTARSVEGDIHVFGPSGQCFIQAEGFRMDNWAEGVAAEDRPIFSRLEYKPDMFYASTNALPELVPDKAEVGLIEAINRSSFYYLRTYFSSVSDDEAASWTWDRQAFYKAAKQVLRQTADGKHPLAQKSWFEDTGSLMREYKENPALKDQPDMRALHVAGEHLAKVMAGEERALEVYLREGVWAPLYSHGRYQVQLNRSIADLARTFAHRCPHAKYLEVGAGSGGTTLGVLEQIGGALDQYTFTDVSAGFFEKAREKLASTTAAAEDRLAYKVLDLERDPLEQGFEPESQDVIIAANVLHATSDLTGAVKNVRRLLKPGGYLLLLEVTGEYLGGLLLMGALEGWWLGNREGRASQPGLNLQGWDDVLRETGFSGIDKHQSDVPDSTTQAVSVIVSQASDTRVEMLREPLDFLDELPVNDQLLVVGGESLAMSKVVRAISQQVSRFAGSVQTVASVDKIDSEVHMKSPTAVIALCDLEKPFFASPVTEIRLKKLQHLFSNATDVLWVTTGHLDDHDATAAMMIGLCRTMVIELENLNLQFLNTSNKNARPSDARVIVEAFVRLQLGASEAFAASPILWSTEPELTLTTEGEILIPRLKPDVERNNRLNSAARQITKSVKPSDLAANKYTIVSRDGHIHLEEYFPWLLPAIRQRLTPEAMTTIRARISVTLPQSSSAVLVAGFDEKATPVLALTNAHSSVVSVPLASTLPWKGDAPCTAQQLRSLAQLILARHVLAAISTGISLRDPVIVVHGASTSLAQAITQLADKQLRLVFTGSTDSVQSSTVAFVGLHIKSSDYILRRSLPARVGFVVTFGKDDVVARKLTSIFPGTAIDLDAMLAMGTNVPLADLGDLVSQFSMLQGVGTESEVVVPAYSLPGLPTSTLEYPAVVDWAAESDSPLMINVTPISGQGLFSPDKSYLMVSLVSTLGRSICRWMVENGARHIALASRSAKVDEQWLDEMAQLGANIRVYRMDVSDKQSVQSTVAQMRAEMPPIAGVANAALVLRDRMFLDMDEPDITEVLAPKVAGSQYLHEEFQDPLLDFFILFSTLSCVIGNAGQSNYDAASLYQVMLAKHRRQQGLPASVMEVGCVADVGYVAERGQALFDKLARTMKLPLSESDVHQIFAEAVAASPIRPDEDVDSTTAELVTGMGYYNYSAGTASEAHPPWFNNLITSHYVREERGSGAVATDAAADHLSVVARLDSTTSAEAAASVLTQALAARVETMLQMASGSFKTAASLLDVGIDSLLAVELRTWFLKEVHVDVPILKILSGESSEAICAFAAAQYLTEKSKAQVSTDTAEIEPAKAADASSAAETSSTSSKNADDSSRPTSVSGGEVDDEADEKEVKDVPPPETLRSTAPMTPAQARLWVGDQVSSDPTQNNNILIYDVHGSLHVARLRRAVAAVVAHHPGLHTCFFQDATNAPLQGLLKSPPDSFRHIEASSEGTKKAEVLKKWQHELTSRKWRLQQGQALEVVLISHSGNEHTLKIAFHHIAMDGSAWRTFFRDLHMAYQGTPLLPISKSPIDVASQKASSAPGPANEFWLQELSPLPGPFPILPFASTTLRPSLEKLGNHRSLGEVDGSVAKRIDVACRSLGVTKVDFFLAAMYFLLTRLADKGDICIGVTDSGRNAETAESVGFFLNMLPLRLRTSQSRSFAELIRQTNKTHRSAREHASVPLDSILDLVGVRRDPTCTPVFQVAFDLRPGQNADKIPLGNCQLSIRESIDSRLPYDITFCAIPMPTTGPSYVQVITRSDLYSQEATDLLAKMYTTLIESAVQVSAADGPLEQLQIYPAAGVQKALELGMPKLKTFPGWPSTITERVDCMCQEFSTSTAIKDACGALTYAELSRLVMYLSVRLLPFRGRRIAVLCEPQREWIVGMLAVIRVGATFVSLDATLPSERLLAMSRACEPSLILYHAGTAALASKIAQQSDSAAQVLYFEDTKQISPGVDDPINLEETSAASLILCTSGTSGVPKAILLKSSGYLNYLANQGELQNFQHGEVMLQKANLGFDMAIAEALLALTHGCTLIIAPQASRGDPVEITTLLAREGVNITFASPTEYLMWLRYGNDALVSLQGWRLALCGGEKVPEALRKELATLPLPPVFQDAYGPTEISVAATMQHNDIPLREYPLTSGATSIGRPLHNVGIFVRDAPGAICPPGIPGEICVTGAGVALGYLDQEATSKSFVERFDVASPSQGRVYKTGDRGVWREDGTLGYLGRMTNDSVVKIRGLRVDLTDVENAILSQASHIVSDVVVTMHREGDDSFLVAHVVVRASVRNVERSDQEHHLETESLLEDLIQQLSLPRHMKPSRINVLASMPLTANGKVDRRKLNQIVLPPREGNNQQGESPSSIATLTQVQLHLLWGRVLGRSDIPRRTDVDIWAMGASSLHLVKLQAAIRTEFQFNVPIRDMFMHSTLGGMADMIDQRQAAREPSDAKSIDWDQETDLTPEVRKSLVSSYDTQLPSKDKALCREVLLTGADSFLGGHIIQTLLNNHSIQRVHCVAVPSTAVLPRDPTRISRHEGSLHQQNFGLDEETISKLVDSVDRIIIAGSQGNCLNNYASLRHPNVAGTKTLAAWALGRNVPLHFVSSSRVTLFDKDAQAALPPISVQGHQPPRDGSEGLTASKWASEAFLERLSAESKTYVSGLAITIHRPCALVGSKAPSDDSLNAILNCSARFDAVPKVSGLRMSGYFDFAPVEKIAGELVDVITQESQPPSLRFRHYSSGVKVLPTQLRGWMEKVHGRPFGELELEEWITKALEHGLEPMIAVYLRTVVGGGMEMVFPFMGTPAPDLES